MLYSRNVCEGLWLEREGHLLSALVSWVFGNGLDWTVTQRLEMWCA
jgi:hypothetical protein